MISQKYKTNLYIAWTSHLILFSLKKIIINKAKYLFHKSYEFIMYKM